MDSASPAGAAGVAAPIEGGGQPRGLRNRWDALINALLIGTVAALVVVYALPIFAPSLYAMSSTHQFGSVRAGTPVQHIFTVRNLHPWPVRVTGVSSDCGCTRMFVGRTPPFTLKSLQSVDISTSLNTSGKKGYVSQRILVSTQDNAKSAELVLTGTVQ